MRFLTAIAVLGFVTAVAAQQASIKPIATTGELMAVMVVPSSTVVFKAASEPPKDDDGWSAVRANALTLAESGNLLMIGSRARNRGEWMKMAAAMRDAAVMGVKAADARDGDALSEAGERVYSTCEQCHARYLQPSQP